MWGCCSSADACVERGEWRGGQARWQSSEVDIEGLQDAPAAERAIAVVDRVAHEDLSAGLA